MKKKPKDKEPDFQDEVMAALQRGAPRPKDNGKPVATYEISRTTEHVLSEIKYVLTVGLRPFDDMAGGFPFGRICEVYGLESCGKTALVLRTAIRAQQFQICEISRQPDGNIVYTPVDPAHCDVAVLYIDNEQSVDDDSKLIIDGKQGDVILARADTVDHIFKMVEVVIQTARDREIRFTEEGNPRKQFVVVVVDTIAATSSRQELEQDWGKDDYPRQAQQISAGFRQIVRDINRHNVCMICTNQTRENIQASERGGRRIRLPTPQDSEYTTFGGRALRFYASHRIFMFQIASKYKLVPGSQFSAGYLIGFRTIKNRIRKPLREGRMVIIFDDQNGGLHDTFSVLETLIFLGFAEVQNKEKGTHIVFKFMSNKIPLKTFGVDHTVTTFAEDDEKPAAKRGRGRKDPFIETRSEWPSFYEAHKEDFDALWDAAVTYAFTIEGFGNEATGREETDEVEEIPGE